MSRAPAKKSAQKREPLTRERILEAALQVADREGIDALTLRRLAGELGMHFTAIYNHLSSKEALLDAIVERLIAEANLPESYDDWRDWVRTFAAAMRSMARAHPGAFSVFMKRPAQGPYAAQHTEAALRSFRRAGFSPALAADAVQGTSLALFGLAFNETAPATPMVAPDLTHLSRDRYPAMFEAAEAAEDSREMWDLMVDSVIRGLETRAGKKRKRD